jgi:hypothetical protein
VAQNIAPRIEIHLTVFTWQLLFRLSIHCGKFMSTPSPFFRELVRPRLFQTVCLYCGAVLGYSPDASVIALMERVHACPTLRQDREDEAVGGK